MKHNSAINFAVISAIMALASGCAGDEPPRKASGKSEIRFAASTEYTRAGEINTNNLTQFQVYAYLNGQQSANPYMDNVTVSKTSNNLWTYSPLAYWPTSGTLSFYAFAPEGWVGQGGPLNPVTWDNNGDGFSAAATDIIYAVSPDMAGFTSSPNAQVVFNFRHALSKLTVKMSSSNQNLKVQVSNVAVAGLMSRGNFVFPSGNTSDSPSATNVGTWSDQNTPVPILLHVSGAPSDVITLTTTPTDMGNTTSGLGGSKFVIPQLLTWRSNGNGKDTYITVMCSVYDADTGAKLWPNANTPVENIVQGSIFGDGLLKFPLSTSSFSEWLPGYSYTYNLIINSNEEMGTINFGTPTVDSFVEIDTSYE